MKETELIQHIQECLCKQYPLSCTTKFIRDYLSEVAGIEFDMESMRNFLKRYANTEWEQGGGGKGRPLYWRFKDGLLD